MVQRFQVQSDEDACCDELLVVLVLVLLVVRIDAIIRVGLDLKRNLTTSRLLKPESIRRGMPARDGRRQLSESANLSGDGASWVWREWPDGPGGW